VEKKMLYWQEIFMISIPALDGSATGENKGLLTAILNPDAAVESRYAVFRLNKKMAVAWMDIW